MDYKEKVIALLDSKELSQEQKEKLESIFPELAESGDERIRKALIAYFKHHKIGVNIFYGVKGDDVLAWLEKQSEKKSVTIDIDKMVDDYANNKGHGNEEFGKPVSCMIRAYKQGLNDAIGRVYTLY